MNNYVYKLSYYYIYDIILSNFIHNIFELILSKCLLNKQCKSFLRINPLFISMRTFCYYTFIIISLFYIFCKFIIQIVRQKYYC